MMVTKASASGVCPASMSDVICERGDIGPRYGPVLFQTLATASIEETAKACVEREADRGRVTYPIEQIVEVAAWPIPVHSRSPDRNGGAMPELILRGHFNLLVDKRGASREGVASFEVPSGVGMVNVCVDLREKRITSLTTAVEISDESYAMLASSEVGGASALKQLDIRGAVEDLHSATRTVISMLKYHLNYTWIREDLYSVQSEEWECGESGWRRMPPEIKISMELHQEIPFSTLTVEALQSQLEIARVPLIGMRHLHRAKNESLPHYKWIDATTAAELCIKEILIRKRPDLERLLLELPSPPLPKLYGTVLEGYLGQRSPYVSEISKGVETRNALLHKPASKVIDLHEAIEYVDMVGAAIWHALNLLYPSDKIVRNHQG